MRERRHGQVHDAPLGARQLVVLQAHGEEYQSLWAKVKSIAPKISCVPQTLLGWVQQHEMGGGPRDGVTLAEAKRVKACAQWPRFALRS